MERDKHEIVACPSAPRSHPCRPPGWRCWNGIGVFLTVLVLFPSASALTKYLQAGPRHPVDHPSSIRAAVADRTFSRTVEDARWKSGHGPASLELVLSQRPSPTGSQPACRSALQPHSSACAQPENETIWPLTLPWFGSPLPFPLPALVPPHPEPQARRVAELNSGSATLWPRPGLRQVRHNWKSGNEHAFPSDPVGHRTGKLRACPHRRCCGASGLSQMIQ